MRSESRWSATTRPAPTGRDGPRARSRIATPARSTAGSPRTRGRRTSAIETALAALERMLHRAGNVDGEGDGCGLLIDIPRELWAEEVRAGGHAPDHALDPAFAVAHILIPRTRRRREGAGARADEPDRAARARRARGRRRQHRARAAGARGGAALLAGRRADPGAGALLRADGAAGAGARRARGLVLAPTRSSTRCSAPRPCSAATTPTCATPRAKTAVAARPQPLLHQHLAELPAGAAVRRARPQRRDQHDRPAAPGGAHARRAAGRGRLGLAGPDPHRARRWSSASGLSLVEALELVLPPIVNEIKGMPEELRGFYMYLRQAFGPLAQGPVALVSRHGDECVFSVDALGLRPLWQLETADGARVLERAGRGRDRGRGGRAQAARPGREGAGAARRAGARALVGHTELQRLCLARWQERAGRRRRRSREAIPTGGPLEGPDVPGYTSAGPSEPVKVEDRVLGGFGWQREDMKLVQQMAATGAEPIGSLGLRRPARLPLAGAPEPGRLLQGVGGGGDQPGDRPRARGRALLLPRGVRPAPGARRASRRARPPSRRPSR